MKMETSEIIAQYLNAVIEGLKSDASDKGQKIPVSSFRIEVSETEGKLFGAHYFKYLITGRGPGKAPPPEAMLKFVQDNPEILAEAKQRFQGITEKGLAYLIGRKIAKSGTDIFQGKKPGIDFQGVVEGSMEEFLKMLAYHEALKVAGTLKEAAQAA